MALFGFARYRQGTHGKSVTVGNPVEGGNRQTCGKCPTRCENGILAGEAAKANPLRSFIKVTEDHSGERGQIIQRISNMIQLCAA